MIYNNDDNLSPEHVQNPCFAKYIHPTHTVNEAFYQVCLILGGISSIN